MSRVVVPSYIHLGGAAEMSVCFDRLRPRRLPFSIVLSTTALRLVLFDLFCPTRP